MPRPLVAALAALAAAVCFAAPAAADSRPSSSGAYAEGGGGAALFLGTAADYSRVGPMFSVRVGYDLFPWFSLGAHLGASTHEATVPPPPEGEYYQLYAGAADGRLSVATGRLGLFVDGGLGLAAVSSNVLAKVDILEPGQRFSLHLAAGGGLEYQLQNRHYAFGLAGQWVMLPDFAATQSVTTRLYLRYTY